MSNPVQLTPDVSRNVTFQTYSRQPAIDGVFYRELAKHRAPEGWFMELLRLTEGAVEDLPVPFDFRQISLSKAVPHRLNAFHIHPKTVQDELWSVVDGQMLVWLVDCRQGSSSVGVKQKFILTAESPAMLLIPSGVAHGYKAGPDGALLVYSMNSQFSSAEPNEGRLPWDYFGAELWEEDRG